MWWFTEFNGVTLPLGNFVTNLNLAFAENRMRTTGGEGEYDLDGNVNPLAQQSYSCEFTLPKCDYDTKYNALKGAMRRRGLLKRANYTTIQRATAKVTSIADTTTPSDLFARTKRMTVTFTAEPYWYDDTLTTVSFTSATRVFLTSSYNQGNARAIKYVVLTITSNISTLLTLGISPYGDSAFYGEFDYGDEYYGGIDLGNEASAFTYTGNTSGAFVIDAGNSTVRLAGVDVYANVTLPSTQMALLWLEPGQGEINFNQAVTGSLAFRSAWL